MKIIIQAERDLGNFFFSFLFSGLKITNTIKAPKNALIKDKLAYAINANKIKIIVNAINLLSFNTARISVIYANLFINLFKPKHL